jgi:cell division protein FtsQ
MADSSSSDTRVVSMLDRRRELKRQRQTQILKASWRTTASLGFALTLGWLFNKSGWQITKASQVSITGNNQISTQTLETFLPLTFPTSLLRAKPGEIKSMLEQNTHADQVSVNRQLFPPRILVRLQERAPVALTTCPNCLLVTHNPDAPKQTITIGPSDLWLIDDRGIPLPYESYPKLGRTSKAPDLITTGYLKPLDAKEAKAVSTKNIAGRPTLVAIDPTFQNAWKSVYGPIHRNPVKVQQIDWQKPGHLNLKTELGTVQLGPIGSNISEQLLALDRMRSLPQTVDAKNIKFINLENPKNPIIELNTVPVAPKPPDNP